MKAIIQAGESEFTTDLSSPIDLSIPLKPGVGSVNAFYIPPVIIEPIRMGNFVGSVSEGGSCNVNNITFNPHGNGTHTECVGHISRESYSVNDCFKGFFFLARLVSVEPFVSENGDMYITPESLLPVMPNGNVSALIIRTLPNDESKRTRNYSGTNPPYVLPDAMRLIVSMGIEHLLLDLPSVDKEDDGGKLSAHHIFWNYPGPAVREHSTITELIYVPNSAEDGTYLLNLQLPGVVNDAAPSRPLLYRITGMTKNDNSGVSE